MTRMDRTYLSFGALAAFAFVVHTTAFAILLPGYDPVSQTISEIGERGSPFEFAFRIAELGVAACLLLFAIGFWNHSSKTNRSVLPALMIGSYALANVGTAVFAAPHPLHNVFGISMTVGFLAPLALVLSWPEEDAFHLHSVSAVGGAVMVIALMFNLSPVFIDYAPADFVRANYGAIQRLLLIPFHLWCGFLAAGLLLTGSGTPHPFRDARG